MLSVKNSDTKQLRFPKQDHWPKQFLALDIFFEHGASLFFKYFVVHYFTFEDSFDVVLNVSERWCSIQNVKIFGNRPQTLKLDGISTIQNTVNNSCTVYHNRCTVRFSTVELLCTVCILCTIISTPLKSASRGLESSLNFCQLKKNIRKKK